MAEYSFTYRNNSLDLSRTTDTELFIKASRAGFSFLIVSNGTLLAWKDDCPISELSDNHELALIMASPFKQVTIGIAPEALTLVPSTIFADENVGDYARFLDVMPDDRIFAGKLDADNEVVYKTDYTFLNFLVSRFSLQSTVPADRGWIAAIAKTEPANYNIFIDVAGEQITILNFKNEKLRFYNVFKAEDVNDIIYYSLFVAQRLDIQPEYSQLCISGHIAARDFEKLGEFFRTVKYNDLKVFEVPAGVPSHQILSLAALA